MHHPLVHVEIDAASAAECAELVELAQRAGLQRALTKGKVTTKGRTSDVVWLAHDVSPVVWALTLRLAALANMPLRCAEHWQVIRYEEGGEYRRHYDSYCPEKSSGYARATRTSGNRVVTCLLYLNTVEKGGATRFFRLPGESGAPPRDVQPIEGSALIFENCHAWRGDGAGSDGAAPLAGAPRVAVRHPLSEHAGMPVRRGAKWAANLWFRERPTLQGIASLRRCSAAASVAAAPPPLPLPPSDAAWIARLDALCRAARAAAATGQPAGALALLRDAAAHCGTGRLPPRLERRIEILTSLVARAGGAGDQRAPDGGGAPVVAVIFDLDGTLVDSTRLAFDSTNVVLAAAGHSAVTEAQYHAGCMHTTPRRLALHACGDSTNVALGDALAAKFDAHYIARVDQQSAGFFAGADAMLRELAALPKVRLGVLSNACGTYVRAVLRANIPGLARCAPCQGAAAAARGTEGAAARGKEEEEEAAATAEWCDIPIPRAAQLGADDVPEAKPGPAGVMQCLAALGVTPSTTHVWYVGDSPSDGDAARAAKCGAIGVAWGAHSAERNAAHFDVVASTMEELAALLRGRIKGAQL